MNVALVENAEDQVDHDQRRHDQQRHGAERLLERLRGALEARVERGRRAELDHRLVASASVACPSATPWARLKLMVIAGNWPWWLIESERHRHAGPGRERRQRHLVAGQRRLDVELVEGVEIALQFGQDLQDHVIAVELGEILGDLALAERVVQRVVDQLRLDAVARGGVAVDLQLQRGALRSAGRWRRRAVRGSVFILAQDLRRPFVQLVEVGVLQREFELGAGRPAAEPHVLRRLHVTAARPRPFRASGAAGR